MPVLYCLPAGCTTMIMMTIAMVHRRRCRDCRNNNDKTKEEGGYRAPQKGVWIVGWAKYKSSVGRSQRKRNRLGGGLEGYCARGASAATSRPRAASPAKGPAVGEGRAAVGGSRPPEACCLPAIGCRGARHGQSAPTAQRLGPDWLPHRQRRRISRAD